MNLDEIKRRTGEELRGAVHSDEPVLLEAPPASGKTHNAIKLAAVEGLNITYFAGRVDLHEQALDIATEDDDISFDTIPSPHRDCPTFRGENNGDTEKAKRLYQKGVSGRDIHYRSRNSVYTPCMAGGDCRYIKKRGRVGDDEYLADIDLLIGDHQHAYNEAYLADRVVIFDDFNPDPFVSRFPNDDAEFATNSPAAIIKTFLGAVDEFPFNDVTDLIEARTTQSSDSFCPLVDSGILATEPTSAQASSHYHTSRLYLEGLIEILYFNVYIEIHVSISRYLPDSR